jgi:hypothetical protein
MDFIDNSEWHRCTRRQASQWGFTMASYDGTVIDRLSSLPPEDVLYVTYATIEDDTGNRYLQGYIKTSRRFRVDKLKDLIGPAVFTIVTRVLDILVEIQLQASYSEFGDPKTARLSGFRNDLMAFKDGIKHRVLAPDKLKTRHPRLFEDYPRLAAKYIRETLSLQSHP